MFLSNSGEMTDAENAALELTRGSGYGVERPADRRLSSLCSEEESLAAMGGEGRLGYDGRDA